MIQSAYHVMGIALGGFWIVADLLRQQQAFWQLPTLVLVSEGGRGGSLCRL
jgi:hypothetical protein